MSERIKFTIDGVDVEATPGQTIMQAADEAGIYIPRLCAHNDLSPFGSCRVCTVLVNDRPQSACTQPVAPGMIVENDTEQLRQVRVNIIEMLFVEGNHYCPLRKERQLRTPGPGIQAGNACPQVSLHVQRA